MKCSSWFAAAVVCVVVFGVSASPALLADQSGPGISASAARAWLNEAHRAMLLGIRSIDAAQKEVSAADEFTSARLRIYQQRHWQKLAGVISVERELLAAQMAPDAPLQGDLGERVSRAHLGALRLRSEFESFNAPTGTVGPGCLGSISGNLQGPGGPVEGAVVQAFVAEGSSVGSGFTDINGDYFIDLLPLDDYYVVTSNSFGLIDEVFDDVSCPGGACDPTIGSAVTVDPGTTTTNIDFDLVAGGGISGAVTGAPVPSFFLTTVNIFDASGSVVTSASADFFTGVYTTLTGLPSGTYYAATADILSGYLDELYDNIPCAAGLSCDPTSGTPIVVVAPNMASGRDFLLTLGGNISGNVTDSDTTNGIENIIVGIHDSSGLLISFAATDAGGNYTGLVGLATADYFVVTGNFEGYVDELYDGTACTGGLCDVTTGDEVSVTAGATTSDIDFALSTGGTFSGTVTKDSDGQPIAGAFLLAYSATGIPIGTAETDNSGQYTITTGLGTGSYRASTLNPYGYDDELFDDMPCLFGACDASAGTPIAVTIGVDTPNIDFGLAGNSIGACDFEDCSTCDLDVTP